METNLNDIYKQVALKYNIPIKDIALLYSHYWKGMRMMLSLTEVNDDCKLNMNIPCIGKLYFNKNKYNKVKEKYDNKED